MKRISLIVLILLLSAIIVEAAPKNDLVHRFADILKLNGSHPADIQKTNDVTKITPLFVRSARENSIDLTMLIAYDKNITKLARTITSEDITPLIFSVSTMPFIKTIFEPSLFCFEQDGIRWFPNSSETTPDIFPLGDNSAFGGTISDNEIQQGVILLPSSFNVTKPIKITYKNFKKLVSLDR